MTFRWSCVRATEGTTNPITPLLLSCTDFFRLVKLNKLVHGHLLGDLEKVSGERDEESTS